MEDDLNFVLKWNTAFMFWLMEDHLNVFHIEDDLNIRNWRQTKIFLQMEEDLIFFKQRTTSKKIMQQKAMKSYSNGCGTAPGNLVII
jgi:hypothetical protein